jgi:alpha-L-fucosidase 2
MKKTIITTALCALAAAMNLCAGDLTMWYQQPAADNKAMNEALPIGNARMGGLIFGKPERERICLNEDSLWTGGENPDGNYDTMGAYQVLGNAFVNLLGQTNVSGYRRELNLGDALAKVSYTANGVKFRREFFCSHPAGVLAAQFSADKKAAYSGSIELADGHVGKVVVAGNRFTVTGTLDNGMKFEWQVLALNQGGTVTTVTDTNSTRLEFKNCDNLTLLVAAGTDYVFDYAKQYHGDDPHARVTAQIDAAAKKRILQIKNRTHSGLPVACSTVSAPTLASPATRKPRCRRTSARLRRSRRLIPDWKHCCFNTAATC